ncbi:MAG: RagB/SusD family nutrient uptake outer membrane protein [Capnocytophaga felis]|nr:RagB/SusD family nutrient uptake outer membrane protein [Capnocytophaga felis]
MKIVYKIGSMALFFAFTACNDFLDREPLTDVAPNQYFNTEQDLSDYTITRYSFPTHQNWNAGTFIDDNHTDNQATSSANGRWKKGEWRVPVRNSNHDNASDYDFKKIREINFFFEQVEPKIAEGKITGNTANINHYLGEAYFLRAYEYFKKLRAFGDYPIIKKVLADDKAVLIEASKRQPRNQVARFILEDLDKAISLLKESPVQGKNRISKEVALLFRSRVALFEGTWLKYHKGTAFVPGGAGWNGSTANYPLGGIDQEIDYFLTEAMASSKEVADAVALTQSNHNVTGKEMFENPYYKMFGDLDMSSYTDVLLWRQANAEFFGHHTMHYLKGGANSGYTRAFMETFLMKNGLPIYATNSGYQGDQTLKKVKQDRDERLQLFVRANGDYISIITREITAPFPDILSDVAEQKAVTGYDVNKGLYPDFKYHEGANLTETGCIVFRATEAYLNYIEASYEKEKTLNGTALGYWKQLRLRAGLPEDPNVTISATDLSKEVDWAVYSAGNRVDVTLYNIRRERRCEFIAEGMRYDDLKRWKSLDQVSNYQIEGMNLWAEMHNSNEYKDNNGVSKFKTLPDASPNMSSKTLSNYIRPYQIVQANNLYYDGYNWTLAHYLSPIPYENFVQTSTDGNVSSSVIYQNPGWPISANGGAL